MEEVLNFVIGDDGVKVKDNLVRIGSDAFYGCHKISHRLLFPPPVFLSADIHSTSVARFQRWLSEKITLSRAYPTTRSLIQESNISE